MRQVTMRVRTGILLLSWLLLATLAYPAGAAFEPVDLSLPLLYQANYTDVLFDWKGEEKSVATSGCGAVSAAMVLAYYHGEDAPGPDELMLWAFEEGLYRGNGLSLKTLTRMMEAHGIPSRWIKLQKTTLYETLARGQAVIVAVGAGYFSTGGHYIVLRGINQAGEVLVEDPSSPKRSARSYPVSVILREAKGGNPFLVCDTPVDGI